MHTQQQHSDQQNQQDGRTFCEQLFTFKVGKELRAQFEVNFSVKLRDVGSFAQCVNMESVLIRINAQNDGEEETQIKI